MGPNDEPMSTEDYVNLLQLGGDNENLANQIALMKAQADHLRMDSLGGARNYGRAAIAPSWLELLGGLARNKAAQNQTNEVGRMQGRSTANKQIQDALIMKGILSRYSNQQPGAAPMGATPPPPASPGATVSPIAPPAVTSDSVRDLPARGGRMDQLAAPAGPMSDPTLRPRGVPPGDRLPPTFNPYSY